MSAAGDSMFLGIRLQLDATGIVRGATIANNAFTSVQNTAVRANQTISKSTSDVAGTYWKASMAIGAMVGGLSKLDNMVQNKILNPVVDEARQFEVELQRLRFVSQASNKELAEMSLYAKNVGKTTQLSSVEGVKAMRILRSSGLDTKKMYEALKPAIDATVASGGAIDLETAAAAASAIIGKFGPQGEDAARGFNSFYNAVRETKTDAKDLMAMLNSLGTAPVFGKLSSAEAFGVAGVLKNIGQLPAQAAANVKIMENNLIANQKFLRRLLEQEGMTQEEFYSKDEKYLKKVLKGRVAFKEKILAMRLFNVPIFDEKGAQRNFTELLADLGDRAHEIKTKMSEEKYLTSISALVGAEARNVVAGVESYTRAGKMGGAALRDLIGTITNTQNAARDGASAMEGTLMGIETFITGSIDTIQGSIGEKLLPTLKTLDNVLKNNINRFLDFVLGNDSAATASASLAVVLSITSKAVLALGGAMSATLFWTSFLGPAIAEAGGFAVLAAKGFQTLKFALLGSIAGAAILVGVFAGIYGAIELYNYIMKETTKNPFFTRIRYFINDIKLLWSAFSELIEKGYISDKLFQILWRRGLDGVVMFFLQIKQRISWIFEGIWKGIQEVFIPIMKTLGNVLTTIGVFILDLFHFMGILNGKDLREATEGWKKFGYIVGVFASIWMFNLITRSLIFVVNVIPQMLAGIIKLTARFIILGAKIMIVSTKALLGLIKTSLVFVFRTVPLLIKSIVRLIVNFVRLAVAIMVQLIPALIKSVPMFYAQAQAMWAGAAGANAIAARLLILVGVFLLAYKAGQKLKEVLDSLEFGADKKFGPGAVMEKYKKQVQASGMSVDQKKALLKGLENSQKTAGPGMSQLASLEFVQRGGLSPREAMLALTREKMKKGEITGADAAAFQQKHAKELSAPTALEAWKTIEQFAALNAAKNGGKDGQRVSKTNTVTIQKVEVTMPDTSPESAKKFWDNIGQSFESSSEEEADVNFAY